MDIDNKESHQSGQSFSSSVSSSPNPSCSSHHKKRKAGRKKFRETRHPVYRGVRQRNGNKWVCEIREPIKKTRIWVGTYPTPEMAARAHDVAVLALRGTSTSPAKFNFPDSVSLLPSAKSCSAVDIRAAAAKATSTREASNSKGIGEKHDHETETVVFFDEEALYNMPALLDSMAEGLLITPPSTKTALDWDDVASQIDLTLWTN